MGGMQLDGWILKPTIINTISVGHDRNGGPRRPLSSD
jgi:hypothetical protein